MEQPKINNIEHKKYPLEIDPRIHSKSRLKYLHKSIQHAKHQHLQTLKAENIIRLRRIPRHNVH